MDTVLLVSNVSFLMTHVQPLFMNIPRKSEFATLYQNIQKRTPRSVGLYMIVLYILEIAIVLIVVE